MGSKRNLLFATLLFVSACSSHGQMRDVIPNGTVQSRNFSAGADASCAIVPNTSVPLPGYVGGVSVNDAWDVAIDASAFQHFIGGAWRAVPPPVLPGAFAVVRLVGLVPIASNDVWTSALGTDRFGGNRTAFFLHWNGSLWTYVPSDPTLTTDNQIEDIAGDGSTNVFALVQSTASPPGHGPSGQSPTIQLERWNGSKWSLVASQRSTSFIIGGGSRLVVVGPNDVWMMLTTSSNTFVSHWNGATLTTSALPLLNGLAPHGEFIAGTADNDIWITGFAGNNGAFYIVNRSTSFGLYNTSLVAGYGPNGLLDFKPGYVLMPALDPNAMSALLVYNGYVRWRPTLAPWPSGTTGLESASIVKGTTSFWASLQFNFPTGAAALFQCPSRPPAPL